jgi:hypothetical protein
MALNSLLMALKNGIKKTLSSNEQLFGAVIQVKRFI